MVKHLYSNSVSLNDSNRVRDMNFGMNHFVLFIIGDEITRLYVKNYLYDSKEEDTKLTKGGYK